MKSLILLFVMAFSLPPTESIFASFRPIIIRPSGSFFLGILGDKTNTKLIAKSPLLTKHSADIPSKVKHNNPNDESLHKKMLPKEFKTALSVFVGVALTFAINNFLSFGPIKASSFIGLLSALLLPENFALAMFCGSFAGMAKLPVIPSYAHSLILGILCACVLGLFDKMKLFLGIGGRLGFIAQIACSLQFLVHSFFRKQETTASFFGVYPRPRELVTLLFPVCLATTTGALMMCAWRAIMVKHSQNQKFSEFTRTLLNRLSTTVAASSIVGLFSLVFRPTISGPIFCGSFVSMSSPQKIETFGGIVGASLMAGVSQLMMAECLLGGWGGRLGTGSFFGVLQYKIICRFFHRLNGYVSKETIKKES